MSKTKESKITEVKLFRISITGTPQSIKKQFTVFNSYLNTEVTDYTIKLKSLQIGLEALIDSYAREKKLAQRIWSELGECLKEHKEPNDEIEKKVKEIIVEWLGVKEAEVTPEASFIDDLGADSLDTVDVVMALEEEFGIEIPDEKAEELKTVGDATEYVNKVTKEGK